MNTIGAADVLKPFGHYARISVHHDLVYLSGQPPFDHKTGERNQGTAAEPPSERTRCEGKSDGGIFRGLWVVRGRGYFSWRWCQDKRFL